MIDEKKLIDELDKTIDLWQNGYGEKNEALCFSIVDFKNIVNNQPKIGIWILCSDRLPENEEIVLLSLKNLDICVGFNADFEKRFYIVGYGYTNYENVLAWRPLPEPYTEKRQD